MFGRRGVRLCGIYLLHWIPPLSSSNNENVFGRLGKSSVSTGCRDTVSHPQCPPTIGTVLHLVAVEPGWDLESSREWNPDTLEAWCRNRTPTSTTRSDRKRNGVK